MTRFFGGNVVLDLKAFDLTSEGRCEGTRVEFSDRSDTGSAGE